MNEADFYDAAVRLAEQVVVLTGHSLNEEEYSRTPQRFADLLAHLLNRHMEMKPELTTFPTMNNELITISPIEFYSLCPHHLALIMGKAYVGYIPSNRVLGLSKVPRLVRWMGASLIKQEDLTVQVAKELQEALFSKETQSLEPARRSNGVAVVLKAIHTCMTVRGVRVNQDCTTVTSCMTGCFLDPNKQARSEFLALANRH